MAYLLKQAPSRRAAVAQRWFWSRYSRAYDSLWDNALADRVATAVVSALAGRVEVLEVGAGTGILTRRLLAAGFEVRATEPEPHMAAVFAHRLPQVEISNHRCAELQASTRSRAVVAMNVLHMVHDVEPALAGLARAAGPDGMIVLVTPEPDVNLLRVARAQRLCGVPRMAVWRFIATHLALAPLTRAASMAVDPSALARLAAFPALDTIAGVSRISTLTAAQIDRRQACAAVAG